jgi:predicted regulator of Ras-like GTPase activity (Roadblock/LC7/MglB family)
MPFQRIVDELVESTPGATGVILADAEGESIVCAGSADEYDLRLLAAHKGIILGQVQEVNSRLFGACSSELVVTTDTGRCIVGTVGTDYSLSMTLNRNAPVGPALYRFRKARELLVKEIY